MQIKGKKVKKRHAASVMAGFIGASLIADALRKKRREKQERRRYLSALRESLIEFGAAGTNDMPEVKEANDLYPLDDSASSKTRDYRNRHKVRRGKQRRLRSKIDMLEERNQPCTGKCAREVEKLRKEYDHIEAEIQKDIEEYRRTHDVAVNELPQDQTLCKTDTYYVKTYSPSGYACA